MLGSAPILLRASPRSPRLHLRNIRFYYLPPVPIIIIIVSWNILTASNNNYYFEVIEWSSSSLVCWSPNSIEWIRNASSDRFVPLRAVRFGSCKITIDRLLIYDRTERSDDPWVAVASLGEWMGPAEEINTMESGANWYPNHRIGGIYYSYIERPLTRSIVTLACYDRSINWEPIDRATHDLFSIFLLLD